MWEEALICMCVYLGVFFILPDTIRRPFTSKRYILWTIGFGVALVLLSAYGLYRLTRRAEKFQVDVENTCSGVKCPSSCLFRASLSASGSLSGISYLSGYENCLIPGMDISGVHVSGSVRVESVSETSAQLDISKTYTASGSNLLSGSTNPVCYANTRALRSADQDQTIGFNLYGRYVRIYAPKDETVAAFTATLNSTGGLSNIAVTSGSVAPGMYIFGTSQANGVSLSAYDAAAKTAQLDRSKTYTAGSLNLTAKLSDGIFGLSQVMVYNAKGDNIASGKPTTGTRSTYSGGGTASSVVDGTTIPRAAPNATGSNRAWGNANTLGRDNDYWEVDLGTRQMIPTIRIISPNDYGDTRNVSGGGGNRVKGLRISVLETATETPSLNGKCAASPLIIYPVLTTGTQITDEEKKVIGPQILNGIDGEKVLRIHRLLNERYPTVQISDLRPYFSDEQIVTLYKSIENGNNAKDSTDGLITPANAQALRNIVKVVRSITDIPTTTVASTQTAPAIRNFPEAVTKFMTARVVIMKRIKNSANGSPMMDSSGRPIIEDVSDRGIPAALMKLVEPLKPVSQNNSSLGYSSGGISGTAVDGSAYSEENNVPADLASGGAAVENRPVPTATTNPDGSIRIAETGALSDIDAYLLQSGYQAPTGNLSKALPQWYLSIGPFSYNNAVLKCAEGGDKLITLAQLRAAQAAGARYNVAGWVKDVTDRVYTIQDTPTTYAMVRAPIEGCPAGTTGGPTGCSVTQTPVPVTGCPTGTTASSTGCSAALTARNFDCPAGLTATTTGCNPLQLVTTNGTCPAGTTVSGTTCTAPGTCTGGQVIAGVCYPSCPANTTVSGTTCTAPGTCAGRKIANTCYPSCPVNTSANGANCEAAGECRRTNIAGGCYYPCETGETMSGTTCTGAIVTVSAPPAAGASAHCYGMKESFWPSARSIIASWTNRDISIPDGQIVPLPSVGSAPNQDPGGPIDIANTYKADDWNKRSKNDPLKNKEVFHISSRYIYTKAEAQAVCQSIGADLATFDQMTHAFNGGAQWCGTGWLKDKDVAYYPMQETDIAGCSGGIPQLIEYTPPNGRAAANCYGVKPSRLENLFTLTNTGIITANKRGRYVRIFNTDKLANLNERYISLTQVLITDSADTVISTGATAIQYNPTVDWDPAANGYPDGATDVGAQKLLQYTTKQTPKAWNLGYQSSSRSDDQFVEIDLGKAFADRKGVIKNIEIVPHSGTGFGQTPDRATGLRVVISNAPYVYPFSNKVGQYAWNQTTLNLADSCGLSSDGTMKYKKTCEIGGGKTVNVCVTDMTIGCDQICIEGKTLQGKPCAPDRNTVPKSQYGAEADINFEFQMYQIGYLYSGKGVAAKDGAGVENPALNPYHSKNMSAVTVSVYQKCEDQDQSKGTWTALDVGWCSKPIWYAPCPDNYDDWNGVLHVCCTCYRGATTWYGPDTYARTCSGGDPVIHTGTWYGPDTYARTYFWLYSLGGDPVIHTGTWYGPDRYAVTCSGGDPVIHTSGGDTIPKSSDPPRDFKREWQNRQFTDPVKWAQAQQNVGESITRYFGGIKRATLILSGRSEGVKRKYFGIEALGINHLLAYTKELSKHDNSVGGATYINLIKSYVNSADIKSCDRMRSTLTTMFGVETGIDSQPCFEGGPMLFWKKAADVNGPGACPLADGLPGWTAAALSTAETGRTFMDHILKHAIIAAPAAYAYKYSTEYKNDIVKLKSGREWETDTTVPMNSESPPKPNYALLSFDARCSITNNAMYEVMSHIGAAVWAGQSVTPYFGGKFSTADDVIEACMRQGDNPNGGVWTLATVVVNGPNRNQTKTFSPPVIGRYVRVRPGTSGGSTLQFIQIVVKDPAGNRIAASRVYATSTFSTNGASNAYNGANNSLYHGAKGGMDSFYNEFWEVDLGANKNIGSIDYIGRIDCCPDAVNGDRIGGTRISVWPSRIGWDIPVNAFTTIDQDKYTIDRMVQAKVIDGTVKNYSQCANNADIKGWAQAAALPGDDGNANNTLRRICAPYFNTSVWTPGDTSEDRKGNYKAQIGATNR